MNDVLRKYGIPVGIVIAAIVAIYFYGKARYDAGRQDLRTELLLQKPEVKTTKDSSKTISGEAKGRPYYGSGLTHPLDSAEGHLFDRKWTRMNTQLDIDSVSDTPDMIVLHSDSCCDAMTPYIVQVHDSLLTGEIICKPDVQKALWRLRPITETKEYTKYVEEQLSFWMTPLMGLNSSGTSVGCLIGYKTVGLGISYDGSPTYWATLHFDF